MTSVAASALATSLRQNGSPAEPRSGHRHFARHSRVQPTFQRRIPPALNLALTASINSKAPHGGRRIKRQSGDLDAPQQPGRPRHRGPHPLLQRGADDRRRGFALPRDAAVGVGLCLRQQFERPHRAQGPRQRRDRHPRAAPGQGQCGQAHVRRHRGRHLRHGRRRRHLCAGRRAAADQHAADRAFRHGGRHAPRRHRRRRPRRPCLRQPHLQRALQAAVRPRLHRHLLRLPRLHAPLRQELPGRFGRLRDRDRDVGARLAAQAAGERDRARLRPPAGRLRVQAVDLQGRREDPLDVRHAGQGNAADALLRRHRGPLCRRQPRADDADPDRICRDRPRAHACRPGCCRSAC